MFTQNTQVGKGEGVISVGDARTALGSGVSGAGMGGGGTRYLEVRNGQGQGGQTWLNCSCSEKHLEIISDPE